VRCRGAAARGPPEAGRVLPSRQSGALRMADGTATRLLLPEIPPLPSPLQGVGPLHAAACLAGPCPLRVIRMRRPLDVDLPWSRHLPCTTERACEQVPVCPRAGPPAGPPPAVPRAQIFLRSPAAGLLRGSPGGPRPPPLEEGGVHGEQGGWAHPGALRVGPPAAHGVALGSQLPRCGVLVGLHHLPQAPEDGCDLLPRRFEHQLPRILSSRRSEAGNAVLEVWDAGLLRREFPPACVQELLHSWCACLCQECIRTELPTGQLDFLS
jgi:hypothetical protein